MQSISFRFKLKLIFKDSLCALRISCKLPYLTLYCTSFISGALAQTITEFPDQPVGVLTGESTVVNIPQLFFCIRVGRLDQCAAVLNNKLTLCKRPCSQALQEFFVISFDFMRTISWRLSCNKEEQKKNCQKLSPVRIEPMTSGSSL